MTQPNNDNLLPAPDLAAAMMDHLKVLLLPPPPPLLLSHPIFSSPTPTRPPQTQTSGPNKIILEYNEIRQPRYGGQTERQTDTQTHGHKDSSTEDKLTHEHTEIQTTDKRRDSRTNVNTDKQTHGDEQLSSICKMSKFTREIYSTANGYHLIFFVKNIEIQD